MKGLPKGWAIGSLTDICIRIVDGSHNPPKASDYGKPMLSARNIQGRRISFEELRIISDTDFELENKRTAVQPDDVLITIVGTIGRTAVVPPDSRPFALQRSVAVLRAPLVARYLSYSLEAPATQKELNDNAKGTAQKGVYLKTLGGLQLPLAPLPEQKRIADKLDSVLARVDACRDRLDRIPALLKRFRQSILAAATSGQLTEDWAVMAADTDWATTDIQSVAQVGTGSTPTRSNPLFYATTGTPWITSAATSEALVQRAEQFVTDEAITAHRLRIYPAGTLLVAMYGEGKTRGQVTELGIAATINQACAAVVVNESLVLKAYVKLVLQANYLEMRALAEGGNQPNLNLSKIKEFSFDLPSLPEQHEIVRRVDTLFAFADRLEARCAAARKQVGQLTPALLAKAFRGELVPQDPTDEPATELLKRLAVSRSAAPKTWRGRKADA